MDDRFPGSDAARGVTGATKAVVLGNEHERLGALHAYDVLDSLPEREFDDLALAAARLCDTPFALVSLVDGDRHWLKATVGLIETETLRDVAFCAHAILQRDVFVVENALADQRFSSDPLVMGPPYVRFYAGAPLLTTDGQALGTLCVLDRTPRPLTVQQAEALRALSRQVVAQLELRRIRKALSRTTAETRASMEALRASEEFKTRLIECSRDCIKVLDLDGRLLSMNAGGMEALEICELAPFVNTSWIDFWQGEDRERAQAAVHAARNGHVGRFVGRFRTMQTGKPLWFDVVVNAILDADGRPQRLLALSRDVTELKHAEEVLWQAHDELDRKVRERTAALAQANTALQSEVIDRKQAEATLRAIVEGVEAETGDRFFPSLVRHLAAALRVQYAFVSELSDDRMRFKTLAVWGRGAALPNFEIPLAGTPCEAVLMGEMQHYPDCLQARFPEDKGLVDWQAESYCGVPLLDSSGAVVGHLAILDDQPMPQGARAQSIMRIFATRVCAELERLRVDAALRESEARYRDLYDEAPVAYLSVGTDGYIRRANRCAAEMFGYPREQLIGQQAFDLAADTPYGKPRSRAAYERFLAGIETVNEEVECRRAGGEPLWIRLSVRPMRDAEGRIEATRSTLVDITDRKRAEAALRDSEERLSRILESAMDAIVTMDEHYRIVLFNAAAEKIFGCRATEVIGQALDPFLTTAFRRALDRFLQTLRGGGQVRPYVWAPEGLTARSSEGREFPIEATISQVQVGGRTLYTLILRDIDARRRAEQELRQLHQQNEYLQEEIRSTHNVDEIVGQSRVLAGVLEKVQLVAATDSSVLILGETGTGKEIIARAIHSSSRRKERPLIKVNCAALPTGLVESELFGHEKGAFTGATDRRIGRFELADGGTIFLDEIGELSPEVQVKLLRVLQEHEFERIGGSKTIRVDVRVIAATNRDLARAASDGTFRQDLYYRLNVFPIALPALRTRRDDIPLLVHYFVSRFATKIGRRITRVARETMQRLVAYSWPGNVRELENVIERAVILSPGAELQVAPELLVETTTIAAPVPAPAPVLGVEPGMGVAVGSEAVSMEQVERRHILSVLKQTRWRVDGPTGAARLLNMHPSTLRSRMKKLGIQRSHDEAS
jgi:formate hydrogenlyase transcriptional activator